MPVKSKISKSQTLKSSLSVNIRWGMSAATLCPRREQPQWLFDLSARSVSPCGSVWGLSRDPLGRGDCWYRARLLVDEGQCLKRKRRLTRSRFKRLLSRVLLFQWRSISSGRTLNGKGDKKVEQWRNTLDYYVVPRIGHRAIANLTVRDIYEVLTQSGEAANGDQIDNLWLDRQKVASDIRQRIENIISRSIGYYDLRIANPAAKANGLGPLLPSQAKPVNITLI